MKQKREWQVEGANGTYVFYDPEDVRAWLDVHCAAQIENWNPEESSQIGFKVRSVTRYVV